MNPEGAEMESFVSFPSILTEKAFENDPERCIQ